MTHLERVETTAAPPPFGHYAQATATPDGTVWVSAQLPVGVPADADTATQARQVLANLLAVVRGAGAEVGSVARVTLYLTDIGDWGAVDAAFGEAFGEHRPARTVVGIDRLHHGFRVAADAVAWRVRGETP